MIDLKHVLEQDSHTARFLFDRLFQGPLLAHRTVVSKITLPVNIKLEKRLPQVLVTHHVELVLPGTYYLVRMLDGRIDTQGTVKELRSRGVLDDITHDEAVEAHKEEQEAVAIEKKDNADIDAEAEANSDSKPIEKAKKPRKLIEEEKRETGSVKWHIYNTYLRAS